MKTSIKAITLAVAALAFSASVGAVQTPSTGTIHFSGVISAGVCSLDTQSANQTVDMGKYIVKDFKKGMTKPVPFDIKLKDCDGASVAHITFNSTAISQKAGTFGLSPASTARNVGLEIKEDDGVAIQPNTPSRAQQIRDDKTLHFTANYIGTGGDVFPGTVKNDVNFLVDYD